jgi:hypothetical protein
MRRKRGGIEPRAFRRKSMRTFKVSDELYDQLKSFVVDPFDDTPEVVIGRLIEIVAKAKDRWPAFEACDDAKDSEPTAKSRPAHKEIEEEEPVVVL